MKKKARKAVAKEWAKLTAVKNKFNIAMSSCMTLEARIQSDESWQWAKGFDMEELRTKKGMLDKFCDHSEFWKAFAVHDMPMREAAVNMLEWKIKQLSNMHNARVCTGK